MDRFCGLVVSDIHAGHRKTKTDDIIYGLDQLIMPLITSNPRKLDAVFITGDTFDRLLTTTSEDFNTMIGWCFKLMLVCGKHGVAVRVLEGTRTHDAHQPRLLTLAHRNLTNAIDFKYIDTVCCETLCGKSIFYVPDNWRTNNDDTHADVVNALTECGLAKADLGMMHGMFEFQLPKGVTSNDTHKDYKYLDLVNDFIFIGHDHEHKTHGKIIVPGSFDRTGHGYESKKGAILFTCKPDGNEWVFLKNPYATKYVTVKLKSDDIQTNMQVIASKLKGIPVGSHVRLMMSKTNPLSHGLDELRRCYFGVDFTVSTMADDNDPIKTVKMFDAKYTPEPVIDRETMLNRIKAQLAQLTSPVDPSLVESILAEVL